MKNDLMPGYMFGSEAAAYLRTTERKISLFRRYGLLKSCRLGKGYLYRREWLDAFAESWADYDLSSESAIRLAIKSKEWKKNHGC